MDSRLVELSQFYEVTPIEISECLNKTADNLKITSSVVVSILTKYSKSLGLNEISLDLLPQIFEKLPLKDIISTCGTNKKYYQWCQNNDIYWRRYAQEKFQLREKPSKFKTWFDLIRSIPALTSVGLRIEQFKDQLVLVEDKFNYQYYSAEVKIRSSGEIILDVGFKQHYKFNPDSELLSAIFLNRVKSSQRPRLFLLALDRDGGLRVYQMDLPGKSRFPDTIQPIVNWQEINFPLKGVIVQTEKYRPHKAYFLTKENLYDVYITSQDQLQFKVIKTPINFKKIYFFTRQPVIIAGVDSKGQLWIKGHALQQKMKIWYGEYKIIKNKFILIPSPKVKDLFLGFGNMMVLDETGSIWALGKWVYDTVRSKKYSKFTKITTLKEEGGTKIVNISKVKAISEYGYKPLLLTENNEIYHLNGFADEYRNLIELPSSYIMVHFT